MNTVLLPVPENIDFSNYALHCGQFVVELCLLAQSSTRNTIGNVANSPQPVSSTFWLPGSMLPYDVAKSLTDARYPADTISLASGWHNASRLQFLRESLTDRIPLPIFTNQGIGHWLIVWGFEGDDFLVFDVRKSASRDARGLTRYSSKELLRVWGGWSLPYWGLFPLRIIGGHLSRRLDAAPFTVVVYDPFSHG